MHFHPGPFRVPPFLFLHHTPAAGFNSSLYVVAATVIPVFLVALMVEGNFVKQLVDGTLTLGLDAIPKVGNGDQTDGCASPDDEQSKDRPERKRRAELAQALNSAAQIAIVGVVPFVGPAFGVLAAAKEAREARGAVEVAPKQPRGFSLLPMVPLGVIVAGEICAVLAIDQRHASQLEHILVMVDLIGLPIVLALGAYVSAAIPAYARSRKSGSTPATAQSPPSTPPGEQAA